MCIGLQQKYDNKFAYTIGYAFAFKHTHIIGHDAYHPSYGALYCYKNEGINVTGKMWLLVHSAEPYIGYAGWIVDTERYKYFASKTKIAFMEIRRRREWENN